MKKLYLNIDKSAKLIKDLWSIIRVKWTQFI